MATKMYLRLTTATSKPTAGEKSTALPVGTANNQAITDYTLSTTAGATSNDFEGVASTLGQTGHQDGIIDRWTMDQVLSAQTISANTWTIALQLFESNTNANPFLALSLYVWRPGTSSVVGYIYDSDTALGGEWAATKTGQVITFSGSQVVAQANDLLVLEVWYHAVQAMNANYTNNVYFNGSVDVTAGYTGNSPGSYLSTPQNLTFGGATIIDAHGDGALAVSGTAVAQVRVPAHGDGAVAISGTGAALVDKAAHGDGALTVTGTGVARVLVPGTATGALAVTGTAVGAVIVLASGVGAIATDGAAVGQVVAPATGTGAIAVEGTGAPTVIRYGSAQGAIAITGAALSDAVVPASGQGAIAVAGTGAALVDKFAQGVGALAVDGVAVGSVIVPATGTGAIAVEGVGVPFEPGAVQAHGEGALAVEGTAAGAVVVPATGIGALSVVGAALAANVVPASGAGALSVAGVSVPTVIRMGSGTGALVVAGAGTAVTVIQASAVGALVIVGVGVGSIPTGYMPPLIINTGAARLQRVNTGVLVLPTIPPLRNGRVHEGSESGGALITEDEETANIISEG